MYARIHIFMSKVDVMQPFRLHKPFVFKSKFDFLQQPENDIFFFRLDTTQFQRGWTHKTISSSSVSASQQKWHVSMFIIVRAHFIACQKIMQRWLHRWIIYFTSVQCLPLQKIKKKFVCFTFHVIFLHINKQNECKKKEKPIYFWTVQCCLLSQAICLTYSNASVNFSSIENKPILCHLCGKKKHQQQNKTLK